MSEENKIAMLTSQVENLKAQLQKAIKFKGWCMDTLAKNHIAIVKQDEPADGKEYEETEELFPSTKPLGDLGPNASCYCSHCNKDVAGTAAAPCVRQLCPTCGNQLATRLGIQDDPRKYDYGETPPYDRSKGLKP